VGGLVNIIDRFLANDCPRFITIMASIKGMDQAEFTLFMNHVKLYTPGES